MDRAIDHIDRPSFLLSASSAYAVYVVGESMDKNELVDKELIKKYQNKIYFEHKNDKYSFFFKIRW